jgi:hypothetical protein
VRSITSLSQTFVESRSTALNVRTELLDTYRAPSENSVVVAGTFLGCFQADHIDEIVQRLNHRGISLVEGGDLFCRDGLVSSKGLQDAGVSGA